MALNEDLGAAAALVARLSDLPGIRLRISAGREVPDLVLIDIEIVSEPKPEVRIIVPRAGDESNSATCLVDGFVFEFVRLEDLGAFVAALRDSVDVTIKGSRGFFGLGRSLVMRIPIKTGSEYEAIRVSSEHLSAWESGLLKKS